ncbi:AAA family ATPase [Lachnospiraceae bacterium BSM-380-WT-5A]|uniref:AAA family ATPase n=1 Tax=Oliverpabstia intestinalis TaxID=2606633 RepID=A0A7X2P1Z7_9FIRM|nr:AAA family ATPase [Oliverpabstia intestinalis]MST65630.1 AAA family ATPase [Oliverpabstia intestinalis]
MYISSVSIENFRAFKEKTVFHFNPGVTVLIGENDCGKSTVIDAIRYVLGTTDQSWQRVELSDYHQENTVNEIHITITFSNLTVREKAAFLECLTYTKDEEILIINWSAKYMTNVNPHRTFVSVNCGRNADVAAPSAEARELLRVTYLKPLRDAQAQMKSGRGSRLAQILSSIPDLNLGEREYKEGIDITSLSLAGIFDLSNQLLAEHKVIKAVNKGIGDILNTELMLNNDAVKTQITVAGDGNTDEKKIYSLLEKLDLNIQKDSVSNYGNVGLGTSNLMSMACEMLLNQDNNELSTFMLIEEPEAHIHAQRQLKLIQSMQKKGENQQVIMTTHSPLLASVVELNNLLLIQNRKAFSMREGETMLDSSDYKFLERYLDATKANLFFAKGVIIVEGPGEALLLPTLAQLLNRNLTDYGISIVDVKSTGLRRYARIFQRKEGDEINIPVSCITDRDVMPECAPAICLDEKYKDKENWPKKNRKWKVESEIKDKEKYIQEIEKKANGQNVKTFIPEQWTLEYELAANGLGEEMLQTIATMLAEKIQDKEKNEEKKAELLEKYTKEYNEYKNKEAKASYVYSFFSHKIVSKAEFAQKFSFDLENIFKGKTVEEIVTVLPNYLVKAIEYVTMILSILVDTFISKISLPMQPVPEIGSISVA